MIQAPLLQDQSFDQLVENYASTSQDLLAKLWNDCSTKAESDLLKIADSFKKHISRVKPAHTLALIENGNLVSDVMMSSQKKYPTSDFGIVKTPRYNAVTGKREDDVIKYFLKSGIGRMNVDSYTVKEFNRAKQILQNDIKAFLEVAQTFRETQQEWADFKKNPDNFTDDEMINLRKKVSSAEKAYDEELIKIGLSRDAFDKAGSDVKTYIKGLQQLKKSEIDHLSGKIGILQAQIKIVTAMINKIRGGQNIEMVRNAGKINTGMIDADIEDMITLPAETSKFTVEPEVSSEIPTIA